MTQPAPHFDPWSNNIRYHHEILYVLKHIKTIIQKDAHTCGSLVVRASSRQPNAWSFFSRYFGFRRVFIWTCHLLVLRWHPSALSHALHTLLCAHSINSRLRYFGEELPGSPFELRPLSIHQAKNFGDNFGVDENHNDAVNVEGTSFFGTLIGLPPLISKNRRCEAQLFGAAHGALWATNWNLCLSWIKMSWRFDCREMVGTVYHLCDGWKVKVLERNDVVNLPIILHAKLLWCFMIQKAQLSLPCFCIHHVFLGLIQIYVTAHAFPCKRVYGRARMLYAEAVSRYRFLMLKYMTFCTDVFSSFFGHRVGLNLGVDGATKGMKHSLVAFWTHPLAFDFGLGWSLLHLSAF